MAFHVNFQIDQGTKFEGYATIKHDNGDLFDLTGYTPKSQMKRSYYTNTATDITVSVDGDPLEGVIKLILLPSQTNLLKAGRFVYDVEVHLDVDVEDVKRVLQGIITVTPQVTKI